MKLGEWCAVRSGLTLRVRPSGASPSGVLAVQQSDLSPDGEFLRPQAIRVNVPTRTPHRIAHDELVFRSRGPFWCAWAPGAFDEPIVAVAPLFVLRPAPEIDPAYLAWFISRPSAQRYFDAHAMGSGVQMISKSALQNLPVDVPSLAAQRSIVAIARTAQEERQLAVRHALLHHTLISTALDEAAKRTRSTPEQERTP